MARHTKSMRKEIERLAKKHNFDMSVSYGGFKISNPPYMDLVIEKVGDNLISVCHYREVNGDLCQDPEIVFLIPPAELKDACGWFPIEITGNTYMGYQRVATLDKDGQMKNIYPQAQAQVTTFANTWAKNIKHQGFFSDGELVWLKHEEEKIV